MKKAALLIILPMLLTAGACTSRIGADQYDTSAVGEVNRAVKGTVVSVRQISIASNNGAGTLIGGAAGGRGRLNDRRFGHRAHSGRHRRRGRRRHCRATRRRKDFRLRAAMNM